jgi:glycosyltransferase involved in cell wall biosynthesis
MVFSIIVPFYNAAETLPSTLESVVLQTFQDWELVLVNDGSEDESEAKVQSFLKDHRVRIFHQVNSGVSAARNTGALHATGDYLVFLDADDLLSSSYLSDFYKLTFDDPDLLTCGMKTIFSTGIEKNGSSQSIIPGSWVIKNECFKNLEGFDERLKFAENTEFFFRFDQEVRHRKHIEKCNFIYRQSESGGSKNLQNMVDSILIILKKHDSYLSNHVKHLYHQIAGVNLMRFQNYPIARTHLWKAWIFKPYKLATLGRLGIAFFPPLAKNLYKPKVRK